jgi:uncharacterized tellurite resistance protein B-like protein
MLWRKKKTPEELKSPNAEALRERAKKLSDEEILDGLDQFTSNLGVYLSGHRRTKAYDLLCEIQATASGIYALTETLLERRENPLGIPQQTAIKPARQVRTF